MSALRHLLRVGSMSQSAGVYAGTMILQKLLAFARVLLFAFLMTHVKTQYGLWGLGLMILTVAAPLLTLGSSQGLIRYVSLYEACGRLEEFYRRMRLAVVACAAFLTVVALLGGGWIVRWVIRPCVDAGEIGAAEQWRICWMALGNAMLMALYHNLLGFLSGLRVYRMVAAVEIVFNVAFTLLGLAALAVARTAAALLLAHLGSLALALTCGAFLLHLAVRALAGDRPRGIKLADSSVMVEPVEEDELAAPVPQLVAPTPDFQAEPKGVFARTLRFGVVAMLSNLLWVMVGQISFYLTSRGAASGRAEQGAELLFYLKLGQPITYLSNAVWAVVFTYVARRWEQQDRQSAFRILETSYKALCLGMMTLTVAVYLTAPLWVRVLPAGWRAGEPLVGGVLLFYQATCHLALLNMVASLRERPIVFALAGLVCGALNAALAWWWMPLCAYRPVGAAWAAGAGVYLGGMVVSAAYLLAARVKLQASTFFVLTLPALLLLAVCLPVWAMAATWAGVLATAVFSPWIFTDEQKSILWYQVQKVRRMLRPRSP